MYTLFTIKERKKKKKNDEKRESEREKKRVSVYALIPLVHRHLMYTPQLMGFILKGLKMHVAFCLYVLTNHVLYDPV